MTLRLCSRRHCGLSADGILLQWLQPLRRFERPNPNIIEGRSPVLNYTRWLKASYLAALATVLVLLLSKPEPVRAQRTLAYGFLPSEMSMVMSSTTLAPMATPMSWYMNAVMMLSQAGIPAGMGVGGMGGMMGMGMGGGMMGMGGGMMGMMGMGGMSMMGMGMNGMSMMGGGMMGMGGGMMGMGGGMMGTMMGGTGMVGMGGMMGMPMGGIGMGMGGMGGFAGKGFGGFNGKKPL